MMAYMNRLVILLFEVFISSRRVLDSERRARKHSRCGGLGVLLNAPKPDENPSGMRGNKDEAMKITSTHINLHES